MKRATVLEMEKRTREFFKNAGITVLKSEPVEVSDFGLDDIENVGLQLCVYINTERVCAKEMVLFPYQTCPEHKHVGAKCTVFFIVLFRVRKNRTIRITA